MEKNTIAVAVESAVHDALKEVMQKIADQYSIKVEHVAITWIDGSDDGGFRYLVRTVEARTVKFY